MKNHINPTEIACAIPSLEKLLYIKESQRLCQSVVNLYEQCIYQMISVLRPHYVKPSLSAQRDDGAWL